MREHFAERNANYSQCVCVCVAQTAEIILHSRTTYMHRDSLSCCFFFVRLFVRCLFFSHPWKNSSSVSVWKRKSKVLIWCWVLCLMLTDAQMKLNAAFFFFRRYKFNSAWFEHRKSHYCERSSAQNRIHSPHILDWCVDFSMSNIFTVCIYILIIQRVP